MQGPQEEGGMVPALQGVLATGRRQGVHSLLSHQPNNTGGLVLQLKAVQKGDLLVAF